MYEENSSNFSIRNVVIQFLFVALFIFILIWLFPMKSDLKAAIDGINRKEDNVAVFYDQIFNNNVVAMKDAAKSYYTNERLPKTVGETVKISLGDMLEKKIILPFVDSKGEQCDLVDSYVEVSKHENEFVMKVNLKCTNQENYLLVYMGCYDYCQTAICETSSSDVKQPVIYPTKPTPPIINNIVNNNNTTINNNNTTINNNNNTIINNNNNITINPPSKPVDPEKPDDPKVEYEWEYVKSTNKGHWEESDWSEYSTTPVTPDQYTSVRTKTTTQKVLIGYNETKTFDKTKPIYSTKIVPIGTERILVCNQYEYVASGEVVAGEQWIYEGTKTFYEKPSAAGYKYEFVRFVNENCPNNCTSTVGRIYKVWRQSTQNLKEYKCVNSAYQTIQHTTEVQTLVGYEEVIKRDPVYEMREVKTYSYKKRKYVSAVDEDKKWSFYNDKSLLDNGYQYTGEKRPKTK